MNKSGLPLSTSAAQRIAARHQILGCQLAVEGCLFGCEVPEGDRSGCV
ncbi:hypothetical protein [Streptomyces sp. NPDC001828]